MLSSAASRICAFLLLFASLAIAASPTSFCKCTCFGSYKIIPLDARAADGGGDTSTNPRSLASLSSRADDDDQEKGGDGGDGDTRKEYRQKNCNDCNRLFCLEQNLPECKEAGEKDVFAMCFQRDSSKDEAVVFIFLFATAGLLGWAIFKPCLDRFNERRRDRVQYIPVSGQGR